MRRSSKRSASPHTLLLVAILSLLGGCTQYSHCEDRVCSVSNTRNDQGAGRDQMVVEPPEHRTRGTDFHGHVLDASGSGVADVELRAWASGSGVLSPWSRPQPLYEGRTSSDGSFRFNLPASAHAELEILPPRPFLQPLRRLRVYPGQELSVALRKESTASILISSEAGAPLDGARVRLSLPKASFDRRSGWTLESEVQAEATADEDGIVRLGGIDPDLKYRLEVTPPRGRKDLGPVQLAHWSNGGRIVLPQVGEISGLVEPAERTDFGDLSVHALTSDGTHSRTHVNPTGSFSFTNLPVGEYRIVVTHTGQSKPYEEALDVVVPTGTTGLRIPSPAGKNLVVRLTSEVEISNDKEISVFLIETGGVDRVVHESWGYPSEPFKFEGLRDGRSYHLWVEPAGLSRVSAWQRVDGPFNSRLDVPLQRLSSLEVRIRSEQTPALIRVWAEGANSAIRVDATRKEDLSTFEIAGLAKIPWTVRVEALVGRRWMTFSKPAELGGQVEFRIP